MSRRLIVICALLLWLDNATAEIPHPPLETLEPAVAEQIRAMQALVSDATDDERALRIGELGALYHSLDFEDAALASYREAERLAPADARWPYLRGILHSERGAVELAREGLLEAIALHPELAAGWARLGRLALDGGDAERALLHFQRALLKQPDAVAAIAGAGEALLALGRNDEAIAQLEQALALEPRANRLHYPLAMAYRGLGDDEAMQTHLAAVGPIGVTPDDPISTFMANAAEGSRVHLQLGNTAYQAGDYAAAVTHFTRATEGSPEAAPPWINLGTAQAALGDVPAARASLERALSLEPDNITARDNLLALLIRAKDPDALPLLEAALETAPDHSELLRQRAQLRRATGDPKGAAEDFRRLTDLDPSDRTAWQGLLITRIEAGDNSAVGGLFTQARAALGDLGSFEPDLIDALSVTGKTNPAHATLARTLAADLYRREPSADHALRHVRTLLLGQPDCTTASQWLDAEIVSPATDDAHRQALETLQGELHALERCAAADG